MQVLSLVNLALAFAAVRHALRLRLKPNVDVFESDGEYAGFFWLFFFGGGT